MSWNPYEADDYVDADEIEEFCRALADDHPEWVELTRISESRRGRPILALTISYHQTAPDGSKRGERPAIWLDAGTHASEWTGISAVLYAVSRWVERLIGGDTELRRWFQFHEAVIIPCISPDGVQAMHDGAPYIRSSLRPPQPGEVRSGLDPCDIDDDGAVRMMRWKHPAGSFVKDPDWAPFMRPRTLDDDPEDAYVMCDEGEFIHWDGVRWTSAPLEHGVDLNRNFPAHWTPFSRGGRDSGSYPISEPESRAIVDAFADHPYIGIALTMHTYTGCVLTQPYRENTNLGANDISLMEALADDLVEGTGYDVYKVHPDFTYEEGKPIVGVWADTIATVFGVPGFTVELWDPFGHADAAMENPTEFFRKPDLEKVRKVLRKFAEDEKNVELWREFDHPQLGEVEIGGLEYQRTFRNPPVELLEDECEKAFRMAERARKAAPEVQARVEVRTSTEGAHRVRVVLENTGYLSTSGLHHGRSVAAGHGVSAALEAGEGLEVEGKKRQQLEHLDGWGDVQSQVASTPIYASLPKSGHRQYAEWTIRGSGTVEITWHASRGGRGTEVIELD